MTVDMDLYSRQLGTYGLETMNKLVSMRVLISGLQGPGVETAKNLILAGPGSVTLHDPAPVVIADLGASFAFTEADVGRKSRAQAALEPLKALNAYVEVKESPGVLNEELIARHNCVVVCNGTVSDLKKCNEICRSRGIGFIALGVYGLACSIFVDFGEEFKVTDTDGEQPKQAIVECVVPESEHKLLITCVDDKKLPFQAGDFVQLSEIEGLEGLNDLGPQQVVSCHKHCLVLDVDATSMGKYQKGGLVVQVKQPRVMKFRSYAEALERPVAEEEYGLMMPDLAKFGRSEQLHVAMRGLAEYEEAHKGLPEPRSAAAVAEVLRLAKAFNEKVKSQEAIEGVVSVEEVDEKVVTFLTNFAACQICPMATFVGGIVAQEVIKMTGKYTPLHQWLYFDAFEVAEGLSESAGPQSAEHYRAIGSRYDHQLAIWGSAVQTRLESLKVFLVGAGALGCEYLKNLAMLGCAAGPGGLVTVTDMDRIEVSNLNRQFLFRREHVGQSKSLTAGDAVKKMNPGINVKAIETKVGVDTEDVLTDDFWDKLDLVVNALDNIPSRLYVDGKCVWHLKPLVESGTLGTKGNVQVIVPRQTESYGDARDPPEDSIPLCTLRHFPNQIEHTMEWARDLFAGFFTDAVQETKKVMQNPEGALKALSLNQSISQRKMQLERIESIMEAAQPLPSVENCIVLATRLFHQLFNLDIAQLLYNFPRDHVTSAGVPFWSGSKRAPRILSLDCADPTHLAFVKCTANLFAFALNVAQSNDDQHIAKIASSVELPEFSPRKVVFKVEENEEVQEGGHDDEAECARIEDRIRAMAAQMDKTGVDLQVIEFEKDDDTNYHIDFMAAAGNLRARGYAIPEAERWRAKILAGKIIPAVATATAMITGLASLEIIKLVTREHRPLEHFKNAFANLSLPIWILSEPVGPKKNVEVDYDPISGGALRARPEGFTSWDKCVIHLGGKGVKELAELIGEQFKTEVTILSAGTFCIYNSYVPLKAERAQMTLEELLRDMTQKSPDVKFNKDYVVVQACCTDPDGIDVTIPTVQCFFK